MSSWDMLIMVDGDGNATDMKARGIADRRQFLRAKE
jgi:hypothetical protein